MYQLFYSKQRRKETTETHLPLAREVTMAGGDANDEHTKDGEGGTIDDGAVRRMCAACEDPLWGALSTGQAVLVPHWCIDIV
jgi:hypothetical protein